MQHSFICGHEEGESRNMGRGQARVKRIATYFNRRCIACARAQAIFQAGLLTDIRGNPLDADAYAIAVQKALERVRLAYR